MGLAQCQQLAGGTASTKSWHLLLQRPTRPGRYNSKRSRRACRADAAQKVPGGSVAPGGEHQGLQLEELELQQLRLDQAPAPKAHEAAAGAQQLEPQHLPQQAQQQQQNQHQQHQQQHRQQQQQQGRHHDAAGLSHAAGQQLRQPPQQQQLQQQQPWQQQQPQQQQEPQPDAAAAEQKLRQARSDLLRRMLVFMGPALIIPLGDPLMTLTDTIFIGQCAGTRELAAMGPANICFSFSQYVFQALQVAAISLISEDLRRGLVERAERTFQVALTLALGCGLAVTALMELFAEQLIAGTGADPSLVPLAAGYMRVRAVAQPAVLLTMACQGGLLAQQDSRTPALAVLLSVAVNIASNLVAVAGLGWGLQGAAATTVATQAVGAAALLLVARRRSALAPGLCRVGLDQLALFGATMGPLSVTYVCKNVCYILLQTAAASLSFVQLAAHQAVFSVWNLLAFTTAPLEQAALAYVPAAATRHEQRSTLQLLLLTSLAIGCACGLLAGGVPLLAPGLLTRDAAVWPHMASVAPLATLAMLLTAADVGATGVLLARRDLGYVARAFLLTLGVLAAFVGLCVRGPGGWGLRGVWAGLVLFFGLRCAQSVGRLAWLSSRRAAWRAGPPGGGSDGGAAAATAA